MREIKLTRGQVALVDDEDYERLNQWKWNAVKEPNTFYAKRRMGHSGRTITMQSEIIKIVGTGLIADHKDKNGLNNQKNNLRVATKAQNNCNKKSAKNSSSKYLGVSWHSLLKKWRARICKNRTYTYLGIFDSEKDAALAYNKAAIELHGEFASLNII